MNNKNTVSIEISIKSVILTILVLIGFYILFLIREIIAGFFVSFLLATALNPLVTKMEKIKFPRAISIILLYFTFLGLLVFALSSILPPLVEQTSNLLRILPLGYLTDHFSMGELNLQSVEILTNQFNNFIPIVKIVTSTFSAIVTLITFLVITFYLLLERKNLHKYLKVLFNTKEAEKEAEKLIVKFETHIGGWVRGEAILMLTIGFMTYIGLRLLNVTYALPLAITAGVLEAVPNIGPTLSAIPAILVAFTTSGNPLSSIFVAALYILIQQVENHIIVPKVMQSAAGVSPLVTILAILTGFKLAGVVGAVLAVPAYLFVKIVYQDIIKPRQNI